MESLSQKISCVASQLSHDVFHCVLPGLQFTLLLYNAYQSKPRLAVTVSSALSLSSFQHLMPQTSVVVM